MTHAQQLPSFLTYQAKEIALKYHQFHIGRGRHSPNSLSALKEVIAGQARIIEFDIGLLADDGFALLHDDRLERETNGVGPLKNVTREQLATLRLRDSDEPPALLREVIEVVKAVSYLLKVQVDFKETYPMSQEQAKTLLAVLEPLRENTDVRVVVGCLADWNLRTLRRLDPELEVGVDFSYHLGVPIEGSVRLPLRSNAYGYLDDHPLGYQRVLSPKDYLMDRVETLLALVPNVWEFYLHKDFVLRALVDGFNPSGLSTTTCLVRWWTCGPSTTAPTLPSRS